MKRGFTDDIIEVERPSSSERRKTLSINSSFDEAVAEVEKLDGMEKIIEPIGEDSYVDPDDAGVAEDGKGRPGPHTMYHGQRQDTMFKKVSSEERVRRLWTRETDEVPWRSVHFLAAIRRPLTARKSI